MLIYAFMYVTDTKIMSYEVQKGSITGNYRYRALALRTEEIVSASQSGSVRYYEREGNKASAGSVICSINETGSHDPVTISDFSLNSADAKRLRETLSSFTMDYSGSVFQKTYDLKSSVESRIAEAIDEEYTGYVSVRNQCSTPESGFVIYNLDGFENITESDITPDMFTESNYTATNLRNQTTVTAGEPLFKVVTEESWALYFPVDDRLMTELADTSSLRFRFLKDNETFSAPFSIIINDGTAYGKITLDNSLVRYVTERFQEIELLLNKKSGLKIPGSAIVERVFYRIPEEYAIKNQDTDKEIALKIQHFEDDGSSTVEYVTATVYDYDEEDGVYLVDQQLLNEGDVILLEDSVKQMLLQEKDLETLHGVYNINKGYAVFREITVIDENEEYCIVESNNIYGLAAYDYIVLNAEDVTEDQIVY
jgi:hypothetical protein